jgi:methylmalonyl-CoA mutase N-terminal domain/subunit
MQGAIAQSAYARQKRIEAQEDLIVGVNCFKGLNELEVVTQRKTPEIYNAELMKTAGKRRLDSLSQLKKERNNRDVAESLKKLETAAGDESRNLMPYIIESVKSYATLQEICDVLRGVFGEAEAFQSR